MSDVVEKTSNYAEEKGETHQFETSSSDHATPVVKSPAERALVRKLDVRILPITCLLYLFAYLDRTNLGNARLQGLPQDTLGGDPSGSLYNWVNSAFFFTYIIFQVPATVASKLYPPHYWMGCAAIGWGLCSTLMSTGFNFGSLTTARVFLGIFEASFGPGIPLYFSFFYTKEELGLRMAYWFGFAAIAGAFGGLIAFGVQQAHAAIENWRILFLIEGTPAILLGVACFFLLPARPESTTYLTEDERALAVERMNRHSSGDTGAVVNMKHVKAAFMDWRIYLGGIIYFGANCALASISAFLPTIIKTFGYTNALAQLLTVPPYAVAAVFLALFAFASDRMQSRGLFIATSSTIGGIGYILLVTVTTNVHVKYFAVFCITAGTYTTIGIMIAWFAHNLGSESKKATGIPMFMAIGQCGSILGTHIYLTEDSPRFIKGHAVTCGLELLGAICAIILTISYRYDNHKRDQLYGKPAPNAKIDTQDLADKTPEFRYVP